jgi:hypothetical protein
VIHAKPDDSTIWKSTKNFKIGIVRYNATWEAAGLVMRAAISVFDSAASILALSGSAMAYVAFNKLFMINNFRL